MNKYFKVLLMMVFASLVFMSFTKVNATTITQKPRIVSELKSSENGVYTYNIGLNFEDWIIPAEDEESTPYCLIDGWKIYEKIGDTYTEIYSVDTSSPDFEEMYTIEVNEGEVRTFAVMVFTDAGSESEKSDATVLDHRNLTKVVTKIANGDGCFTITGEGISEKLCGTKNEGRKTYEVPTGTEITVKATPDENFEFDGWYIFDVESDKIGVVVQSTDIEYTFETFETEDNINTIAPAFIRVAYDVIEGANQTYTIDDNTKAEFEIDADYNLFEDGGEVFLDNSDTPLTKGKDYESKAGSTIITLLEDLVDSLTEGEHILKVVFNDNSTATTAFTVAKKVKNEETTTVEPEPTTETKPETSKNTNTNKDNNKNTNKNTKSNTIKAPHTDIVNSNTKDNTLVWAIVFALSVIGLDITIFIDKKSKN